MFFLPTAVNTAYTPLSNPFKEKTNPSGNATWRTAVLQRPEPLLRHIPPSANKGRKDSLKVCRDWKNTIVTSVAKAQEEEMERGMKEGREGAAEKREIA